MKSFLLSFRIVRSVCSLLVTLAVATTAFAGDPVDVSLHFDAARATVGVPLKAKAVLRVGSPYHIYGPDETLGTPTRVTPVPVPGVAMGPRSYPAPRRANYEMLGGELHLYENEVVVSFPVTVLTTFRGNSLDLTVQVDYQPCTDKVCERPRRGQQVRANIPVLGRAESAAPAAAEEPARIGVSGVAKGPADSQGLQGRHETSPPDGVTAHDSSTSGRSDPFRRALEQGLLWALLAAFGWGIAASLSPCVYPMIPITVSYFSSQAKNGSTLRRLSLAVSYVIGMITTYSILGVVAAKLGRDLGAWMVNPWVVGSLAIVLVALACSMFGLYVLQLPPALVNRLGGKERGGHLEALFMGLVLGFVAAPCVGPFAGSILVFVAKSGDSLVGFATLFAFGLGMGLLFIVLAISSSAISQLPRSGMWMVKLEHFFGYVLIGMALYLVSFVLPGWVATWAFGAYLVVGGTYLGAIEPVGEGARGTVSLAKGCGLVAILTGAALLLAGLSAGSLLGDVPVGAVQRQETPGVRWLHSLDEAFSESRRTGKPVFADFYADWCVPCRLMDRTVFPDPQIVEALSGFVTLKVDCTDPDGAGARYKNEMLGSANMPYLAIFGPGGDHLAGDSIEGYARAQDLVPVLRRVAARHAGS